MGAKFFKKKYKKSDSTRNLFEVVGVVYVSEELGLNFTYSRVKNRMKYRQVRETLGSFVAGLDSDLDRLEEQLSTLYEWRFSLGRESSKRQKRELMSERTT